MAVVRREFTDNYILNRLLESETYAVKTIDYAHHEIHSGSSFFVWDRQDLSNGAVFDYTVITPNTTKWAHFVLEAVSESEMCVQMYEDPTLSANGTAMVEYNKNRNSSKTATTQVLYTPTVTSVGTTVIFEDQWGSGRKIGGGSRGVEEWILKQDTKYLVRFTNLTTNANFLSVHFNWYEHSNKE